MVISRRICVRGASVTVSIFICPEDVFFNDTWPHTWVGLADFKYEVNTRVFIVFSFLHNFKRGRNFRFFINKIIFLYQNYQFYLLSNNL